MARLQTALQDFEHKDQIEITYRSYELSPNAEAGSKDSIYESVARKQNASIMDVMESYSQIAEAGRQAGLAFDMDMIIPTNTFDALRLSHYAKESGKQVALMKRLFEAHFAEGIDVADHQELVRLAKEAGLDEEGALAVLESSTYKEEVIGDHASAALMGINSIPYYVINEKYGLSGAQSPADFLDALRQASE